MSERPIALVTGGGTGIGAACCRRLAEDGFRVGVHYRSSAEKALKLVAELPEGFGVQADLSNPEEVEALIKQVKSEAGGIDVLVNNAGVMFERPLEEQGEEEWDLAMAVNLKGPFLMAKHCAASMRARGGGAIVNIGSIEGFCANPFHAAYSASKGGVHGLTVALAVELGPHGVRCNAIAPGWIDTDLNREYVDSHPDRDQVIAELARLHPIGHVGAPSDIGDAVVWLASDQSRFVTGEVITVDGGRTRKPSLPSTFGR